LRELRIGHVLDVVLLNPVELGQVERGRVLGEMVERELRGKDVARHDRRVAVERPAKECEIVHEGVRQVTRVAILLDGGGPMALGELLAVRAENHGDVREDGHGHVEGLVDHDLAWGVGQVVVPANHVRDAHHGVVHDGGEVVGGGAVGTEDDEVVELPGIEGDLAVHRVVDHDVTAVERDLDADGVRLACIHASLRGDGIDAAAGALVTLEGVLACLCGLAVGFELLWGAEAVVGPSLGDEPPCRLAVEAQTIRLPVGAEVTTCAGTLVPVEAEPTHGAEDDLRVLVGRTRRVGVIDAQDERTAVGAGERPVVDCGAGTAHMELSGGGGCEAYADGLVRQEVLLRACRGYVTHRVYVSDVHHISLVSSSFRMNQSLRRTTGLRRTRPSSRHGRM